MVIRLFLIVLTVIIKSFTIQPKKRLNEMTIKRLNKKLVQFLYL
jgi:hypothetical protein